MTNNSGLPKRQPSDKPPLPRPQGKPSGVPAYRPSVPEGDAAPRWTRPAANTPSQPPPPPLPRKPVTRIGGHPAAANEVSQGTPTPARTSQEPTDRPRTTPRPYMRPRPGQASEETALQDVVPAKRRQFKWLYSWKLWLALTALTCGAAGSFAVALLLQIPGLPNCPAIFWPLAPASIRFECARLAASKQTANDLLEAIALVDYLPADHPLRAEADRLIEQWSQEVLTLADGLFNAGKLEDAIAAARRIPEKVSAYRLVEERIRHWRDLWAEAEAIYRKAEAALQALNWRKAFALAIQLRDIDNKYWQTTKYDELLERLTAAREDGNKLGKADRLAAQGGLNNLLEAIKLAAAIGAKSDVHEAAQAAIAKFGRLLLDLAQTRLDAKDLAGAMAIVGKIPNNTNLDEEIKDFTVLANAQSLLWQDSIPAVEEAITQAQRIGADRPLHSKAQRLITRWQLEIEAIAQLDRAKLLAAPGTPEDLAAAIAEASQLARSNPRWDEVQQQIRRWNAQIETLQDQPTLDLAEQMAGPGDVMSLQAAIAQADLIPQGRALYKSAQSKIRTWTSEIQRIQDQPILDQARQYADAGDLKSAIDLANQIQAGRSLYDEAQSAIRTWRSKAQADSNQANAQSTMQEANRLANSGSPTALVNAIQLADQIAPSSNLGTDAANAINEWSWQLLAVARSQAKYDLPGAIGIAQKVPARASAYREAQSQIQTWNQQQNR